MKMNLATFIFSLCILGTSFSAHAMTIREMNTLNKLEKNGNTYSFYYLIGVMEGIVESNNAVVRNGAKPLLCLGGRKLLPAMAQAIYTSELKRNADIYEADMPVELVMRNALITLYAC